MKRFCDIESETRRKLRIAADMVRVRDEIATAQDRGQAFDNFPILVGECATAAGLPVTNDRQAWRSGRDAFVHAVEMLTFYPTHMWSTDASRDAVVAAVQLSPEPVYV